MTTPARAIQVFGENLSNWYVRRSRRRFWKSEADQDKASAHSTLYECLVTLCKLLAPFQPFTTEEMYQNLVRSWNKEAPESVHYCDYPVADPALIDEKLMAETRLVMRVVAVGHAARNQAGVKVRQPLGLAVVKVRSEAEQDGLARLSEQIRDELNVKDVRIVCDDADLVDYTVTAIPNQVGKKYKVLFPAIKTALQDLDAARAAAELRAGRSLNLSVQGQEVTLAPEDVQVQLHPRAGCVLAEDAGYMVAVQTEITEQLRQEGLVRELVRRIQTMRKDADFRIEDSIATFYQASPAVGAVIESWRDYIQQETLSKRLEAGTAPEGAFVQQHDLDGEELELGILRQ